jgi:hypothetical protein
MTYKPQGKVLPTTESKVRAKKDFITNYHANNPQVHAKEIAAKIGTSVGYVWKVISQSRKPSKELRGREGRIFAHGKTYYGLAVMPDTAALLLAPIVNQRTGMKQIGYKKVNPCSCQIHPNGRIIIWPHSTGWKEWLTSEFIRLGWTANIARFVVEQAVIQFSTIEAGAKPIDPTFLPEELFFEAEWGVTIVKDNTPEKGVLEVKFDIPKMQHFLGLPEIRKRLEVIEQGSVTLNQSYKTVVALLLSQNNHWENIIKSMSPKREDDKSC